MQESIEERIGDEYSRIDPEDIVGKRFGKLVVEKMEVYKNHKYYYRCKCDCGKEPLIHRGRILFGATSCGCDTPRPVDPQDIVGKRFHKVLIAEYIGYQKNSSGRNRSYYRCICDCGNEFITSRTRLMYGEVKSCGDCTKIVQEEDHYRYICQNGDSFIFDEIDMELVKSHRWYISNGYPVTRSNGGRYKKLTRMMLDILGSERANIHHLDSDVDHIDGDTRNNRRDNLRVSEHRNNMKNLKLRANNTTGYKGVSFDKSHGKYYAQIGSDGVHHFLGYYNNPEEAARAYDKAARFFHGEFACVNFPLPGEQGCRRNEEKDEAYA